MCVIAVFLALLVACNGSDDPTDPGTTEPSTTDAPTDSGTDTDTDTTDTTDTAGAEGFCAVQALFAPNCLQCHSADAAFGDLDLQTDAHAALVDVVGSTGSVLVAPGDPDGSLLLRKLEGTQAAGEGDPMPPTELLPAADVQLVRDWIQAGATSDCSDPVTTTEPAPYHPKGYDDPAVHGPEFKLQAQVCTDCHDAELTFCDSCHGADWQTDCTFCHGDPATGVAAPPRDIDGNDDPETISFPEHTVHVLGDEHEPLHSGWACSECHVEPSDIFSLGHVLNGDTTIGVAEISFGLRSPDAVYTEGVGCSNVWCHGSGQDGGEGSIDLGTDLVCGGCHGVATHWADMSGRHRVHLVEGLGCEECHATAAANPYRIVDFDLHINGVRDVALPVGMTFSAGTCTGTCHNEQHNGRRW